MDEPWDTEPEGEPAWVWDAVNQPVEESGELPGVAEVRERHPKAYDRWTPRADADLAAGYLAGRSIEQLAEEFERQPSAIQRRLERIAFAAMTKARAEPRDAEPS